MTFPILDPQAEALRDAWLEPPSFENTESDTFDCCPTCEHYSDEWNDCKIAEGNPHHTRKGWVCSAYKEKIEED